MEEFTVQTDERLDVRDITDAVEEALPGTATGTATIYSAHTTCGITVNEAEPRLMADLADALDAIITDDGWRHDEIDDNADSHVRAMLVGPGETIPVIEGVLQLGTWQSVLLVDCDGPRERTIRVTAD